MTSGKVRVRQYFGGELFGNTVRHNENNKGNYTNRNLTSFNYQNDGDQTNRQLNQKHYQ